MRLLPHPGCLHDLLFSIVEEELGKDCAKVKTLFKVPEREWISGGWEGLGSGLLSRGHLP